LSPYDKELDSIYLKPGEVYFGENPVVVSTILGSCVSVTMFHPISRTGAICHGLLPRCGGKKLCDRACLEGFKYVDCSIEKMIEKFDALGVRRGDIEVKIFGGADMFGVRSADNRCKSVGMENVMVANAIIGKEGLQVAAFDTRGNQGRKILFLPHTGEVLLKRLRVTEALDSRQSNLIFDGDGQRSKGRTK
jgi:chemotaxis protein CheD